MSVRNIKPKELSDIIADPAELSKGIRIRDDGGLQHPARFENKLFADAKGSGASPYKVQIIYDEAENKFKGRCSCMAARSRPFCKHAVALLAAWSSAPEAFAVSEGPPQGTPGETKKAKVKTSKVNTKNLMAEGVAQAATLVGELAISGLSGLSRQRLEQVESLGANLRESKLRRLSARLQTLAAQMSKSSGIEKSAVTLAQLYSDAVLTVRKLEKHLAGEELEAKYVEELIGKNWGKKDRKSQSGLDLLEYAYIHHTTADDFVIRESRFVDLQSGAHYSEKQILPAFLAKKTQPKDSHGGVVLTNATVGCFPGFPPIRIDLEDPGNRVPADASAFEKLLKVIVPDVETALGAFQERNSDVFAPDAMPIAMRVSAIFVRGRMQIVDAKGSAIFLPAHEGIENALAFAIRGTTLHALFGDIILDGALPTLIPMAALVKSADMWELKPITSAFRTGSNTVDWNETARFAGVSASAVSVGEIRDELAQNLFTGLATLDGRAADSLVARLKEIGLEKQANLLENISRRKTPEEKLDDTVKLFHVLGIALARLSGAVTVDKKQLVSVPTFESVFVQKPPSLLPPRDVAKAQAKGTMNRYESALHLAHFYESMPAEELMANVYPTWADGTATPYVARALAKNAKEAVAICERLLQKKWGARMVRLTALHVLAAVGTKEAEKLLKSASDVGRHPGLPETALAAIAGNLARQVQVTREGKGKSFLDPGEAEKIAGLTNRMINARDRNHRMSGMTELAQSGVTSAIPYLRTAFYDEASGEAKTHAAFCLACLGDFESAPTFLEMLRKRSENPDDARTAARALGTLGDIRGIHELLNAWEESWSPGIVAEALKAVGPAAFEFLSERVENNPELLKRKAALSVLENWGSELTPAFQARMELTRGAQDAEKRMYVLGKLAEANEELTGAWLKEIEEQKLESSEIKRQKKRLMDEKPATPTRTTEPERLSIFSRIAKGLGK